MPAASKVFFSVVLVMSGNCTVSGLWNREVSAIQGYKYTQLLEVAFGTFLIVHYKKAVRYSGMSVKRGSTVLAS